MGPIERYLGPEVPQETLLWQDPVPAVDARAGRRRRHRRAQGAGARLRACPSPSWSRPRGRRPRRSAAATSAAAPTVRRIRLEPQNGWEVNDPDELATVLRTLEGIQESFNAGRRQAGLAGRPDRARRLRRRRAGRQERRPRRRGAVHPGPHRRLAGADRRRVVRGARADRRRVPQLPRQGPAAAGGVPPARPGQPADPERPRDDRARRRPPGPGCERRQSSHGVLTDDRRVVDQRLLREPARPGHDVEGDRTTPRRRSRPATPPAR